MEEPEAQPPLTAWPDLPEDWRRRFGGIARLYGQAAAARFAAARVTIVGVGGVGSWVAESLARSGVGRLRLIDLDDVCITNVNRQLPALDGEIGKPKIAVLAARCRLINPAIRVEEVPAFIAESNLDQYFPAGSPDFVLDCIDRAKLKAALIAHCLRVSRQPIVTVGGAGGRVDATQVRLDDVARAQGDPLLRQVRKALRQTHGLPRYEGRKIGALCVFSAEPLRYPQEDGSCAAAPQPGGASLRMDCASGFGAVTHVTGAFAFAAAGAALRALAAAP